jgi:hypothetical protein
MEFSPQMHGLKKRPADQHRFIITTRQLYNTTMQNGIGSDASDSSVDRFCPSDCRFQLGPE